MGVISPEAKGGKPREEHGEELGCLQERRLAVASPGRNMLYLTCACPTRSREKALERVARRSSQESRSLSPLAAAFPKMQDMQPACVSELQSRRPWRADKIEEPQVSAFIRGRRGGFLGVGQRGTSNLAGDR